MCTQSIHTCIVIHIYTHTHAHLMWLYDMCLFDSLPYMKVPFVLHCCVKELKKFWITCFSVVLILLTGHHIFIIIIIFICCFQMGSCKLLFPVFWTVWMVHHPQRDITLMWIYNQILPCKSMRKFVCWNHCSRINNYLLILPNNKVML